MEGPVIKPMIDIPTSPPGAIDGAKGSGRFVHRDADLARSVLSSDDASTTCAPPAITSW